LPHYLTTTKKSYRYPHPSRSWFPDIRKVTERTIRFCRKTTGQKRIIPNQAFAFSLHLQSAIERIKEKKRPIVHPDLNSVRKNYSKEFQVAIDLRYYRTQFSY